MTSLEKINRPSTHNKRLLSIKYKGIQSYILPELHEVSFYFCKRESKQLNGDTKKRTLFSNREGASSHGPTYKKSKN